MPHHTPLLATIAAGIGLAFILGLIANRLRIFPLVGYLLAGVVVGPFTPGFVADQALANELAEIGVILLMFGVGLHFSLKDLLAVRLIAVPGAIVQIVVATGMGLGLGLLFGWPVESGLIFGLALSVASTVVLLKALQERHIVQTERGRIAVGWLIVEDLAMVLALMLLPTAAQLLQGNSGDQATTWALVLTTLFKVSAFVAFMLLARAQGLEAIYGNAADPDVFGATNAAGAGLWLVAIPSVFEAAQILARARGVNAGLKMVARAQSDEEVAHLRSYGATEVIHGEHELAVAMLARARMLASAPPIPATGAEPPTA
jgi:voltage-gated potassium channel Kch